MPPMSRPLMTAWATVSHIWLDRSLHLQQWLAGVFLRENAGEVAVLPLHADRAAIDVLAVRSELDLAARRHRRVSRGCLLYTSPSPRDRQKSRMPSSA